jgi:hypothetical protein
MYLVTVTNTRTGESMQFYSDTVNPFTASDLFELRQSGHTVTVSSEQREAA